MADYDLTLGPNGAYFIDSADLPAGVGAGDSFSLASLAGNGKLLDDFLGSEKAFGRINSSQNILGAAGTDIDFATMSGTFGISAGTFGAGGYTTTQAGTFRVRVQLAYDTTNVDYCSALQITVNGAPQPAIGKAPAGVSAGGVIVEDVLVLDIGDEVGALNTQESGDGSAVNLVAHASTFYIERVGP